MKVGLCWNFDKPYYSPSDDAKISLWLENCGDHMVYASHIQVEFEFGVYELPEAVCGAITPLMNAYLGTCTLSLPQDKVGPQRFQILYSLYELVNQNWVRRPTHATPKYMINVFSTPVYRIFLSRGVRMEDRAVGDVIENMLTEWGCYPVTVGINIQVPDFRIVPEIDYQIKNSNGLIAIATPRVIESGTQVKHTLAWLHSESAMAYASRKPILILKDKAVNLTGLPSYLNPQIILEYDPSNLQDLKAKLSLVMPGFREAIKQNNSQAFYDTLQEYTIKGFAAFGVVSLIGIIGYVFDEWSKDDNKK